MLKKRHEQLQLMIRGADVFICIFAFLLAYELRSWPKLFPTTDIAPLDSLTWMLVASVAIHLLLYPYFGFYQSLRLKTLIDILSMVVKAALTEFFILGSLVFFFQAKTTSRYFFGLFIALNYGLILSEKIIARIMLASIRKRGYHLRNVLVVGTGKNAEGVVAILRENKHWGYVVRGILCEPGQFVGEGQRELGGVPIIGEYRRLATFVREQAVDEVYFALDDFRNDEITEHVTLCESLGIPARVSFSVFNLAQSQTTYSVLGQVPILTFYTTLRTPAEEFVKRAMDVAISIMGLMVMFVLYPWISWRIRRESPGPVLFRQMRVGENGRLFKCYKFRTMHLDAEEKRHELISDNQMEGPIFKLENDPRVTPFGLFLRRTSLDELPQFINILRGDMSVVGTRPPTPDEVSQYEIRHRRRLSVRPGLTGLWQVSGRNQVRRFEDVVALDLQYIDNWSIFLDVKIIMKTIWVIFRRSGAY